MRYVGADVHKHYTVFCVVTQAGEVEQRVRVENQPERLRDFLADVPRPASVALEAGYHWPPLLELMEESGLEVVLANPWKVKLIAEARIKTDTIDATTLAHLLRLNYLPAAYIPPREVRDLREILRHRARLVRTQTMVKNRIHALLDQNGIRHPFSDLFGKGGREFLRSLQLRPCYQLVLRQLLTLLDTLQGVIKEVTEVIEERGQVTPEARLLTTIPGIGYYSALLVLAEIGDMRRFPSAKKLCSWAGLVPSTYSSGGRTYHGHLPKQGSGWSRPWSGDIDRGGLPRGSWLPSAGSPFPASGSPGREECTEDGRGPATAGDYLSHALPPRTLPGRKSPPAIPCGIIAL